MCYPPDTIKFPGGFPGYGLDVASEGQGAVHFHAQYGDGSLQGQRPPIKQDSGDGSVEGTVSTGDQHYLRLLGSEIHLPSAPPYDDGL